MSRISYYKNHKPNNDGTYGDKDTADLLMSQYVDMFYGKDYLKFKSPKDRAELYRNIASGKQDAFIKKRFSFDKNQVPDPENGFDYSITGRVLRDLIQTRGFWDKNYEGLKIAKGDQADAYNAAGFL